MASTASRGTASAFELTAEEAARGVRLGLGAIDDNDITWVNGVEVGRTSNYSLPRVYDVPARALHAGRNVVAVRVEDSGGGGGIWGDPAGVFLDAGGARRPLGDGWKFRVGAHVAAARRAAHQQGPDGPLQQDGASPARLPIKGVIWYQGESNADSAATRASTKRCSRR